jgi:hypothetical protein
LTPFVSKTLPKVLEDSDSTNVNDNDNRTRWKVPAKRITGQQYLELWKQEGGNDEMGGPQVAEDGQRRNMPEVWEEPATKPKEVEKPKA